MIRQLSVRAKIKRREDLLEVVSQLNRFDLIIITAWALIILVVSIVNRLPPAWRTAVFAAATIAGGALIIIAARTNVWAVALVIGLLLGILIAELRHLK